MVEISGVSDSSLLILKKKGYPRLDMNSSTKSWVDVDGPSEQKRPLFSGVNLSLLVLHPLTFRCESYRDVKHDVNGRRQTAKTTSDFQFFSSNPQIRPTKM